MLANGSSRWRCAPLNVRDRATPLGHGVKKIKHVDAHRWGNVALEILLSLVLRVFLQFHFAIAMDRFRLAAAVVARNEIKLFTLNLSVPLSP